jgi:hypothetical protein
MKRKYTHLVPQNGLIMSVPIECHLDMLNVTLTQWCTVERLEPPNTEASDSAPECVFKLEDTVEVFDSCTLVSERTIPQLNTQSIDMAMVDLTIEHVVLYGNKRANNMYYPKCTVCCLPCHSVDQCHPFVNYCLDQALSQHHLEIVRKIKAAYKMFPRSAQGLPSHPSTVKQLVAALDLGSDMASDDDLIVSDTID